MAKKEIDEKTALQKIEQLCSRKEMCIDDVEKKLRLWGITQPQNIINSLIKNQFVDQRRYVRAFVREKKEYSQWGIYKVKTALMAKKIDSHLISEVLSEFFNETELERLYLLLQKKLRFIKQGNDYEKKAKLYRFALGRGFEHEMIYKVLEKLNFE